MSRPSHDAAECENDIDTSQAQHASASDPAHDVPLPPQRPHSVGQHLHVAHGGAFVSPPSSTTEQSQQSSAKKAATTDQQQQDSESVETEQTQNQKQKQNQTDDHSFSYPIDPTATRNLHGHVDVVPANANGHLHSGMMEVAADGRTPAEIAAAEALLMQKKGGPLRVLFLSSDTGGGHRASAESLAKSFQNHYPGTTYDLLDVWTDHGVWPYYNLVPSYQHLSAHPKQWRLFYHLSNNYLYEVAYDFHSWLTCERRIRRRIKQYKPDVVVSVHPTMNNVPLIATRKVGKKEGRHIPFFTVVTDLGSAHTTWFQRHVEKIFVASDRLATLARRRGRIGDEKLVMSGLPIRHDFAVQAERLGDRTTEGGRAYQARMKQDLGLDPTKRMVLVMGGGEGVGLLSDIVDGLYAKFRRAGVDATICVVCGRNERLRTQLETKDWDRVLQDSHVPRRSKRRRLLDALRPHRSKRIQQTLDRVHHIEELEEEAGVYHAPGAVDVVGLGFVTNMAEHMVAADVLVTKAGPGTIAEAASVGLPVMLTSFLPGQEAGNVNVVLDGGFGDHCEDPDGIADEVSCWLQDEQLMTVMSRQAQEVGHPHAASDIVLEIGQATHEALRRNGMPAAQSQPP
jgi:1,2-diacylglycerol 3-beta-galactosyltransferase